MYLYFLTQSTSVHPQHNFKTGFAMICAQSNNTGYIMAS